MSGSYLSLMNVSSLLQITSSLSDRLPYRSYYVFVNRTA